MRRKGCFHVVSGGCTNQVSTLLGQNAGDALCVFPSQCLASQNHDAGINFIGVQLRLIVCFVDNLTKRTSVDQFVASA